MLDVVVFVDPFEEFQKQRQEMDEAQKEREEIQRQGGTEDERTTWTGKRLREGIGAGSRNSAGGGDGGIGVGKYLKATGEGSGSLGEQAAALEEWEEAVVEEPFKKKAKSGGGFGNFDNW